MEEQPRTSEQALRDNNQIKDALEIYRKDCEDNNVPPGASVFCDMCAVRDLIEEGQSDRARDMTINLAEQNPRDFVLQMWARAVFMHLGLDSEASKSLMMVLAISPENGCEIVARQLRRTGAAKRAQAMLDIGWEHKTKTVRRRDLEAERKKYYGDQYDGTVPPKG